MQLLWDTLAAIGAVFIGGGALVGLAFWLFKLFGEKWLSNKFAQRLATFQHQQAKELEQLRFQINSLFDRKTKVQSKEFEVILEAWARLVDVFHHVQAFTSPLQSYPDLDRMSEAQLDEYLEGTKLEDWQKNELKSQSDKLTYYIKAHVGVRSYECRKYSREYFVYAKKNSIFLPAELKEQMNELHTLVWDALIEHEMNETLKPTPRERDSIRALEKNGPDKMTEIETHIRERLRDDRLS